jgi:cell fate (sporulation/competence/biofilm development) regulator YmcA (YheA/YmcA/DUF963 family)
MTNEQKSALNHAHSALIDYVHFMRLFESRLNFKQDIEETISTINELEKQFPFLDIDNQNIN